MDNGLDPFPSTKAGLKTGRRSVKRGKRKTGPPPPESLPNSEVPSQITSTMTPSSGSENALAPQNTQKMDMPEKPSPQKKYDRRRKLVSTSKKMKGLTPEQAEIRRLRDNENERRRQHVLNAALQKLSVLLPSDIQTGFKKNSRHHILDATLQYIRNMASLVNDFNLNVKRGEVPPPSNIQNLDLETDALEKAKIEAENFRMRPRPRLVEEIETENDEGIADRPYLQYGQNPFMAPCPTTDNSYPAVQSAQGRQYVHPAAGRYPCQPAMAQYLSEPAMAQYLSEPATAQYPSQPTTARYPSEQATLTYPGQSYPFFEQAMPQQNGYSPAYSEPIEGAMLNPQQCGSSLLFQEVDIGYCGRDYRRVSNESGYTSVSPPDSTNQSPANNSLSWP